MNYGILLGVRGDPGGGLVVVRRAGPRDLGAVVVLSEMWAGERVTVGQEADSREWFEERIESYFFVAESDDDGIVGFAQGEARSADTQVTAVLPEGTRYVEITNLYVRPEWRSRSVGSRLLRAVLDAAASDGVERSLLFTATSDVAGILRFYERHGYRPWGIQLVL